MREYIKKRLDRGEYDDADGKANSPGMKHDGLDTDMTGTEENNNQDKSDQEQLYPVLKHVEESLA
jgi:hypothetical protein